MSCGTSEVSRIIERIVQPAAFVPGQCRPDDQVRNFDQIAQFVKSELPEVGVIILDYSAGVDAMLARSSLWSCGRCRNEIPHELADLRQHCWMTTSSSLSVTRLWSAADRRQFGQVVPVGWDVIGAGLARTPGVKRRVGPPASWRRCRPVRHLMRRQGPGASVRPQIHQHPPLQV